MKPHEKIKKFREELGLTQTDFARVVGVSQNNISKYESGLTKFTPNSYIEFLIEKGFDVNTLFDDERQLQKVGETANLLQDPVGQYSRRNDEILINRACEYFGFENREQLNDFFTRLSEKKSNANADILAYRVERLELMMGEFLLNEEEKREKDKKKP